MSTSSRSSWSARRDERKAKPEDRPAPERSPPYQCEFLLNRLIVLIPDAPESPDTRMLVVTVLDAETDASGTVTLQAAWTLQSGQRARATLTQQETLKAAL